MPARGRKPLRNSRAKLKVKWKQYVPPKDEDLISRIAAVKAQEEEEKATATKARNKELDSDDKLVLKTKHTDDSAQSGTPSEDDTESKRDNTNVNGDANSARANGIANDNGSNQDDEAERNDTVVDERAQKSPSKVAMDDAYFRRAGAGEVDFTEFAEAVAKFDQECQTFLHTLSYNAALQKSEFFSQIVGVSGISYSAFDEADDDFDLDKKTTQTAPVIKKSISKVIKKTVAVLTKRPVKPSSVFMIKGAVADAKRLEGLIRRQVNGKTGVMELGEGVRWSSKDARAIAYNKFFAEKCLDGVHTVRANICSFRKEDLCLMLQALPDSVTCLELRTNALGFVC